MVSKVGIWKQLIFSWEEPPVSLSPSVNIFDDLPENKESKKIENLLNAVVAATLSEPSGEKPQS